MLLVPPHLDLVADAISDNLSADELNRVVLSSTGLKYSALSQGEGGPIQSALINLGYLGWERWMLIDILALKIESNAENVVLRRIIFDACPETLVPTQSINDLIKAAKRRLLDMMQVSLTSLDKRIRGQKRNELRAIREKIERLKNLKELHEALHNLYVKLTLQASDTDPSSAVALAIKEATKVLDSASLNAEQRAVEDGWIARIGSAQGDATSAAATKTDVLVQLCRLNENIFTTAKGLSLELLTESLTPTLKVLVPVIRLDNAIRELRAAMISRAIVHRLWQEVENQIPLVDRRLTAPSPEQDNGSDWLSLQLQWLSLAMLKADKEFEDDVENIQNWLFDQDRRRESDAQKIEEYEKQRREAIELFEKRKNYCKLQFLAVDKKLKEDFQLVTEKFSQPLTDYVSSI